MYFSKKSSFTKKKHRNRFLLLIYSLLERLQAGAYTESKEKSMQSSIWGYTGSPPFHKSYFLTLWEQKVCLHAKETSSQDRKTQTVTGKQFPEGKLIMNSTKINYSKDNRSLLNIYEQNVWLMSIIIHSISGLPNIRMVLFPVWTAALFIQSPESLTWLFFFF